MFKKFSIVISFLVIAIGVSVFVVLMMGRRELESQKNAWIALGGTLDPAELAPPVIPDSENAAVAYGPAFAFLDGLSDDENELLGEDPADEPGVVAVLVKCKDVISQLRIASKMEKCRWDIDYAAGFDATLTHLRKIRMAARLLISDARQASEAGHDDEVIRDIETILRLGMHATNDPTLIGQLVAASTIESGINLYEELFRDHTETMENLTPFVKGYDGRALFRQAMITEVAMSQSLIDRPGDWQSNGLDPLPPYAPLVRSWDRAYYLKVMSAIVASCDQSYFDAPLDEVPPPFYAVTSKLLLPALSRAGFVMTETQLRIAMLETAEKLRGYKKEHGAYPEADAKDGVKMPIDPITGKALAYKKTSQGFVLTSAAKVGDGKKIQWVWEK